MTENTSDKLRKHLKALRSHIPVADKQRGSLLMRARLFTWLAIAIEQAQQARLRAPSTIAAFWPLNDEPDLRPLMTQWQESGLTVALPVMKGAGQPLTFHAWNPQIPLIEGPFGVQEPPRTEHPLIPDVVLVPTLGFTAQMDRMGYGQGYYDRTLDSLRAQGHHPVTVGIAWREGLIDAIDPQYQPATHDYRLDGILTPDGWVGGHAPS